MSKKILIVEDEPLIAEDLATMLRAQNYDVLTPCHDGTTALDKIHTHQPDLLLLDIALDSSMNGLELAEIVRAKYKIPFVFITSFSDNYTLDRAKRLLPYGYIVKPFKKKDILSTVEIVFFRMEAEDGSVYKTIEELNSQLNERDHITPKEFDVLMEVVDGLKNEEIAAKHFITVNTVKTHLKRSFIKLGISSRNQIASLLVKK